MCAFLLSFKNSSLIVLQFLACHEGKQVQGAQFKLSFSLRTEGPVLVVSCDNEFAVHPVKCSRLCVCDGFWNESSRSLGALPFYTGCLCKEEAWRASDSTLHEGHPACTQPEQVMINRSSIIEVKDFLNPLLMVLG